MNTFINLLLKAVIVAKLAQKLLKKATQHWNPTPRTEKHHKTTPPPICKAWGTIEGRRLPAGVARVVTRGS